MTKEQLFNQLQISLTNERLFFGHAVIDAQDEAMMVMIKVLNQSVEQILSSGNTQVSQKAIAQAEGIVKIRIKTLQPMAYIVGEVNFAGLVFKSDERALVPRSPIAELIISGFEPWLKIQKINSALDLCTGSGCIGIALGKYYSHIDVDITDISQDALDLAKINIQFNQVENNVRMICSDLYKNINSTYDLIVTNPPYVSEAEYQELPGEYKKEPKIGLTTPQDGLRIPVEIMLQATNYLNDGGFLFLEVGYSDELLEGVFSEIDFDWINFENGGQGVCVFTKELLIKYKKQFIKFLEN